jgi:uncharacterized membrane protein
MIHGTKTEMDPRLERLSFFSDAVFAISITLLVIEIHVPELGAGATDSQWWHALAHLIPHFLAFAMSFLVVGAIWATHHTMIGMMAAFDRRVVWPNLHLLLAIAFLPFTTGLLTAGARSPGPFAVYAASLVLAGLLKIRLTAIALRPDLVALDVDPARVAVEKRRQFVLPGVAFLSLLLAFVVPAWNTLAMALVPILLRLPGLRA